jgi:hypothetical protein
MRPQGAREGGEFWRERGLGDVAGRLDCKGADSHVLQMTTAGCGCGVKAMCWMCFEY